MTMTRKPPGYWTEDNTTSELKIIIDELGDFPTQKELKKMGESGLVNAISINGGFNYFRDKMGCERLRKSPGYWTGENIMSELKLVIEELGHFPSQKKLIKMGKSGLSTAMIRNGGFNYFRDKMGCDIIKKSPGYWTEENIMSELKMVIDELGHFPINDDLNKMGKSGLSFAISEHGGYNYFREKLGYKILKQSNGYWTEEITISKLEPIVEELGHFPTHSELRKLSIHGLQSAIFKYGGFNYFREKMGYKPIYKPDGYWTEEIIMSELEPIVKELGHFPTHTELNEMGKSKLLSAISRNYDNGSNYFSEKMGCELYKSPGIWTEEYTISELKSVIDELGHFPSATEFRELGLHGLVKGIFKHGGSNYFRDKLGYEPLIKPIGYWTEETIISELKSVIDELGHPPSHSELKKLGKGDLGDALGRNSGTVYFMEKCGITLSMQEKYRSELASYINKRGRKTEQFVKDIITEWTEIQNKPAPNCNVKLSKGNVLEFVCDFDKKIGIDVTNTKSSKYVTYQQIERKWKHKDYCLYLDELWIVVFTDVLTSADYETLNRRSPENVKVFSIEGFLRELDYSAENYGKIDRLRECSFHNKEEIINLNRTFDEEYKTMPLNGVFPNT